MYSVTARNSYLGWVLTIAGADTGFSKRRGLDPRYEKQGGGGVAVRFSIDIRVEG